MKRPFLVIAAVCLVLFVVAGVFVGELLPSLVSSPSSSFRARRVASHGPSIWAILQNVSAVVGIASFLIQIVQWGRRKGS